jgi:hypothetical protein
MMLLDLHYKTHWEQHDRQSSSLASTTHQTVDKTCRRSLDHCGMDINQWLHFRSALGLHTG